MKKLLFSFCTILALSLVSCGGNTKTQHEIIIKEETEQEKNTDWIEYGLVNSFDCFKHNSERYYYSAKSSEMLIWYRYVNGEIQYSANGYGTKRLVRNPYTTIKVKNPNTTVNIISKVLKNLPTADCFAFTRHSTYISLMFISSFSI